MGKNKGKGAANLRRINVLKKSKKLYEKEYLRIKSLGFPDVTFSAELIELKDKK